MFKVFNIKNILKVLFVIYMMFLIYILFLKNSYRNNLEFDFFSKEHINYCINLKPLVTMKRYIRAYLNHNVTMWVFFRNLFGNFILFMPMSFFVEYNFKDTSILQYTSCLLFGIIVVEILQFYYMVGVADIDDVILNFLGGILSMNFFRIIKK